MKKLLILINLVCLLIAKDTIVYALSSDITSLDPASANSNESFYVAQQIYDTLFSVDENGLKPNLASSYEISEDGLSYVIKLKNGIYFHPNKIFKKTIELSAKDVVFSLKRQFDKSNPYYKLGFPYIYWNATNLDKTIKDVEAISKYEVKITLNEKDYDLLYNLAGTFCPILSSDYANYLSSINKERELFNTPYSTGAYSLVAWSKDDKIILKANDNYHKGEIKNKRVIFKIIPNPAIRLAELKTKSVDFVDMPSLVSVKESLNNKAIKIYEANGLNIGYMAMNMNRKELANPLVRKAISLAINKKDIINTAYEGFASINNSAIPTNMKGYLDIKSEYDINKAKELLKKAGYENGFSLELWAMPVSRPYMPDAKSVAQIIQDSLAKINIQIKIISFDWGTYLKKASNLEHDLLLLGQTSLNAKAYDMLNTYLNSSQIKAPAENFAAFSDAKFDELLLKAKSLKDENDRLKIYKQAQEIFAKKLPWISIASSKIFVLANPEAKGFSLDSMDKRELYKVYFE